jgi:hypothetical protein
LQTVLEAASSLISCFSCSLSMSKALPQSVSVDLRNKLIALVILLKNPLIVFVFFN